MNQVLFIRLENLPPLLKHQIVLKSASFPKLIAPLTSSLLLD
jgi:hypothetical protein